MDIAIVTGAETPLGLRLIEDLIRQGCRVHGIGNNFSHVTFAHPHFVAHAIDLSDLKTVARTTETILEQEKAIHILIHAIDVTPGAAFEQLSIGNLEAILKIGLLGPVMLTRILMPNLLRFRGQLINIIPANKRGHIASAVNALIEGGLREMNSVLFDQARDAGLRVTNLILRQNTVTDDTTFADKHLQTRIDADHVARTVEQLLNPNEPNVPSEITLYPRLSGAAEESLPKTAVPIDPYSNVVLPPKEYCPPKQKAIPTRKPDHIERTIPYTDEEMEEKIASAIEDYEAHPERYDEPRKQVKNKHKPRESAPSTAPRERSQSAAESDEPKHTESKPDAKQDTEQFEQSKSRRGRRRGGRSRNRNRDQQNDTENPRAETNHSKHGAGNDSVNTETTAKPEQTPQKKGDKPARRGRNRNRKPVIRPEEKYAAYEQAVAPVIERPQTSSDLPRPAPFQVGEVKIEAPKTKPKTKPSKREKAPAKHSKPLESVPETAVVKKKATKKAAKKATTKKAVKKVAAKKTTTKKAAKKVATKKAAKKAVKKAKTAE